MFNSTRSPNYLYLLVFIASTLVSKQSFTQNYQIGKSWDRKPIQKSAPWLQQWAGSVGEVGSSATFFYIGQGLAITNSHVCPNIKKCLNRRIEFPYFRNSQGRTLKGHVGKILIIQPHLDFSLIRIKFSNAHLFKRLPKKMTLSSQAPKPYQSLAVMGYGFFNNEYGVLKTEKGRDCRVWSKSPLIMKRRDLDTINPFPYPVWSFLIGCDVSHGDSGSPILDTKTQQVIGLLWTGVMPKSPRIRKGYLHKLPQSFLWKQLNYAVPSYLIRRAINNSQIGIQI